MKLTFYGAAREVTGSKFLIETEHGKNIFIDCGQFQGKGLETDALNRAVPFPPAAIDHIILTHAHIDHSGLIPFVYRNGFTGSIVQMQRATSAPLCLQTPARYRSRIP